MPSICRAVALCTVAFLALGSAAVRAADPISLQDMGSFHIGGRTVEVTGQPIKEIKFAPNGVPAKVDPNGSYVVEQMYVQYFIPQNKRGAVPLLLWHGGGLTGVTYETTPDGREGWLTDFLRRGWAVYNSDAMERGRSGWPAISPPIWTGEPVMVTPANAFERFRIGAGEGSWNADPSQRKSPPNHQFPVESIMQFGKQFAPRWLSTDEPVLRAYLEEVDKVCPCVILFHSQGGQFGFKAAQARPDKVKALIAVEPAEVGDFDKVAALANIPVLMVYGDFIAENARWTKIRERGGAFAAKIREAGGSVDIIDLPKAGITGNSHMMMMDRNNLQISGLINDWLAKRGLYQ
jgi:hypothetical protein